MRFRRRRRRSAKWTYCDSTVMSLSTGSVVVGGEPVSWVWLMPPARAQFLMDTLMRDRIQFSGAHMWLDFWWQNTNGSATGLPDVDFGIIKTTIADPSSNQPDLTQMVGQWDQPETSATLTSWEGDEDDGTESFLWSHHIKGQSPPNAIVSILNPDTGSTVNRNVVNQSQLIHQGDIDNPHMVCRKFHVTQEWQPDVVVRAKRRLQKGEGILLYSCLPGGPPASGLTAITQVRFRTLSK